MKTCFKKWAIGIIVGLSFGLVSLSSHTSPILGAQKVYAEGASREASGIFTFKNQKQLDLGNLDSLGRATYAHIQLKDSDEPTQKRAARLTYNPVGWHNYKFYYGNGTKKAWLMDRGHLIGYQFSGLNDEARNLVPETHWLNAGNFKGTDESDEDSMLYYENQLDSWLANHQNYYLDYRVTPIYQDSELLPRQVQLDYVGVDSSGQLLTINIGGKSSVDSYGVSHVVLDNVSPNATLDYATGRATNVASTTTSNSSTAVSSQTVESSSSETVIASSSTPAVEQASPSVATQGAATVYVARQGTADVYWYSKANMPSNTNWGNVVTMSEAEAIAAGKRHTSKE
ncbi:DNA/RNA non-specific endonuclease [Streptococcus sciuri]|uniref:DNA/RNA non-specific endonuclease n=1 Tax=Streptococcus sciuri TaxID=2973939 RepID=A0ABT2F6M3_9STRE|nr:DNA/RNA non-specific endonuclease [Streptococcus sciuri]MCS4488140.1 DNA/RNA non-specific endonuclease [Streptococcus sciuri]